jgi:hypothetical protein
VVVDIKENGEPIKEVKKKKKVKVNEAADNMDVMLI